MNIISQGNRAAGRRRGRDTKRDSETERQGEMTETKTKDKIGRKEVIHSDAEIQRPTVSEIYVERKERTQTQRYTLTTSWFISLGAARSRSLRVSQFFLCSSLSLSLFLFLPLSLSLPFSVLAHGPFCLSLSLSLSLSLYISIFLCLASHIFLSL